MINPSNIERFQLKLKNLKESQVIIVKSVEQSLPT